MSLDKIAPWRRGRKRGFAQQCLGDIVPNKQCNCASIHSSSLCAADRDAWTRRFCSGPTGDEVAVFYAIWTIYRKHGVGDGPRLAQTTGGVRQKEAREFQMFVEILDFRCRRCPQKSPKNALHGGMISGPHPPASATPSLCCLRQPLSLSLSLSLFSCALGAWTNGGPHPVVSEASV